MRELGRLEELRLRNDSDPAIRFEHPDPTKHVEFQEVRRERLADWVRHHVLDDEDPPGFDVPDPDSEVYHLSDAQLDALAVRLAEHQVEGEEARSPAEPPVAVPEDDLVGASPVPEGEAPPGPEGR